VDLPPAPTRLRPEFVRRQHVRAFAHLAPALAVFAVVALWQGRAAYELLADTWVWHTGEPVEVIESSSDVHVVAGVARHVRLRALFLADGGVARGAVDDYYTLLDDSVGDGALAARYDPGSGRSALSWSIEAAGWRAAWILTFGLALLGFGVFLARSSWRSLRDLRLARAAARSGETVALEILGRRYRFADGSPVEVTLRARVPRSRPGEPTSYRDPAADAVERELPIDLFDGAPFMVDADHVLAVRADPSRAEVLVLRESFWPYFAPS